MKLKEAGLCQSTALELTENPDILKTLSQESDDRPDLVIGFAAETHDVEKLAMSKLRRKQCDWIIANDVSGDVMGGDQNTACLVTEAGVEVRWPRMSKEKLAEQIVAHIVAERGTHSARYAAE